MKENLSHELTLLYLQSLCNSTTFTPEELYSTYQIKKREFELLISKSNPPVKKEYGCVNRGIEV